MRTTFGLTVLAVLLTGCVSTEHIGRSPSETSYADLNRNLSGQKAHITMQEGTQHTGRILGVSNDSVRWRGANGQTVSVPTERVHVITTNDRWAGLAEGAGIGAAVGTAVFAAGYALNEIWEPPGVTPLAPPILITAGTLFGTMSLIGGIIEGIHEGGKRQYALTEKERRE